MALHTRCLRRIARTPIHRTRWRRIPARCFSSATQGDPEWFQPLREEMLNRDLPSLRSTINEGDEIKLATTLSAFLPREWAPVLSSETPGGSIGHHLIYFNPTLAADKLLPDGTDPLQSPGDPYVRRMWAGGSLRVNKERYFSKKNGWRLNSKAACVERIKEVRLRGIDDAAKIFVTIERRFANMTVLFESMRAAGFDPTKGPKAFFQQQAREVEGWGDAMLIEERNLVFMKQRTTAELEAIKAGEMAPTKYLDPPGQPDFSHALVPTSSLLFRFSALTFNGHAIHLDRDYCRTIEGHRNLLVHGPLSLTLMLKLITARLHSLPGPRQFVQSIEYRNLAPLYCDEELRLCAKEKTGLRTEDGSIYDMWVEGPTGGMAVKGTVRTALVPKEEEPVTYPRFKRIPILNGGTTPATVGKVVTGSLNRVVIDDKLNSGRRRKGNASSDGEARKTIGQVRRELRRGTNLATAAASGTSEQSIKLTPFALPTDSPESDSNKPVESASQSPPENEINEDFRLWRPIHPIEPESSPPASTSPESLSSAPPNAPSAFRGIRFLDTTNRELRPSMSLRARRVLQHATRQNPAKIEFEPIPLIRPFKASPFESEEDRDLFSEQGIRKIAPMKPKIEYKGMSLNELNARRRPGWNEFRDGRWYRIEAGREEERDQKSSG